jgi:superfamily II DNA or RNA helicase
LVICMDVEHARAIAELIERRWRIRPTVATSDDPMASARIARFAKSSDPWIVAVRMVSEGVDIPRLRVGVFATNTTTELFFRQALGRLVRWTRGLRTQRAWMYIPDDLRLRKLADGIAEQRRHSLFKRRRADDEDSLDQIDGAALDEVGDDEQLSLFQAMSAVATGVEDADDPDADDADSPEELVWDDDDDGDESLEIALPPRPRRATSVVVGRDTSLAEAKSKLRKENADLVAHLVAVTGRSHREVNGELNRLAGVSKVTEATADQLQRRLVAGERWVRTL